jgi:hypothetical protein
LASSSAQTSWRSPVAASISTSGCWGSNAAPMRVIGTMPVRAKASGVSRPGTWVTIGAPGLNPSEVLTSAGFIGVPSLLTGIEAVWRFRRRPVSVLESDRVKWSFGYGNRHSVPSGVIGSQRSAVSTATPTGFEPSQIVGSRFIVLRFALTLPLPFASGFSLVSMQLWTRRRPVSFSASRLEALCLGRTLSCLRSVIRSFASPWRITSATLTLALRADFAETFTRPLAIILAWAASPNVTRIFAFC